jgi:hypothetical protein
MIYMHMCICHGQGNRRAKFLAKPLAWRVTRDRSDGELGLAQYKFHGELDADWRGAESSEGQMEGVEILASIPQGCPDKLPKLDDPSYCQAKTVSAVEKKALRHVGAEDSRLWLTNLVRDGDVGLEVASGFTAGQVGQSGVFRVGAKEYAVRVIKDIPKDDFWDFRAAGALKKAPTNAEDAARAVELLREEYNMPPVLNRPTDAQLASRKLGNRKKQERSGRRKAKRKHAGEGALAQDRAHSATAVQNTKEGCMLVAVVMSGGVPTHLSLAESVEVNGTERCWLYGQVPRCAKGVYGPGFIDTNDGLRKHFQVGQFPPNWDESGKSGGWKGCIDDMSAPTAKNTKYVVIADGFTLTRGGRIPQAVKKAIIERAKKHGDDLEIK